MVWSDTWRKEMLVVGSLVQCMPTLYCIADCIRRSILARSLPCIWMYSEHFLTTTTVFVFKAPTSSVVGKLPMSRILSHTVNDFFPF